MSRSLLIGAILAGLIVFLWSAVSHMLLPWHDMVYKSFADDAAVGAVLVQQAEGNGMYAIPGPNHDKQAMSAAMKAGPTAVVALTVDGMDPANPRPFILQLVFDLVAALLLARLLACIGPQAFSVRLRLVVLVAFLAGLMIHLPYWAWYGFSGAFTAVNMIDLVIGWGLGGLVLARFAGR